MKHIFYAVVVGVILMTLRGVLFHSSGPSFMHSAAHYMPAGGEGGAAQALFGRNLGLKTLDGSVYFVPYDNVENLDIQQMEYQAPPTLDIAMYAFTDFNIARALGALAMHGVKIRIYRDRGQWEQEYNRRSPVIEMLMSSPNIEIRVKGNNTLMHEKAWCNGRILREGSANWSPSGEMRQDNTATFTSDQDSIKGFENQFEAMWDRPDNIIIK